MTVPTTMADLSTTAASNSPSGSDLKSQGDDNIRVAFAILRGLAFKGSDITSASSLSLGSAFGSIFKVTGTTGVTGISSTNSWAGRRVEFWHTGTQTWTHSSTLYFADTGNHTFVNGDVSAWEDVDGAGTWKCVGTSAATEQMNNLKFIGSGGKLTANLSASGNNRFAIQSDTSDSTLDIIPAASGTSGSLMIFDDDDRTTADYLQLFVGSTFASFNTHGVPLKMGANSNYFQIDTSGRLTNVSNTQPAFRATRITTAQTSGSTAIFNSASTNQGSNYNASTGVFTAPVTGFYMFSMFMVLTNTTGSTLNLSPVIQTGASLTLTGNDRDLPTATTVKHSDSCLAFLTAADTVSCSPGTFTANFTLGTGSTFCGALIY